MPKEEILERLERMLEIFDRMDGELIGSYEENGLLGVRKGDGEGLAIYGYHYTIANPTHLHYQECLLHRFQSKWHLFLSVFF